MDEAILKRAMEGGSDDEEEEEEEYIEQEPEVEQEEEEEPAEAADEYDNATNYNPSSGQLGEAAGHLALEAESLPAIPAYEPAEIKAMEGISLVLEPLEGEAPPNPAAKSEALPFADVPNLPADPAAVTSSPVATAAALDTLVPDVPPLPSLLPSLPRFQQPRTGQVRNRGPRQRAFAPRGPGSYPMGVTPDFMSLQRLQAARMKELQYPPAYIGSTVKIIPRLLPELTLPVDPTEPEVLSNLNREATPETSTENPPFTTATATSSTTKAASAESGDVGELPNFDDYEFDDLPTIEKIDGHYQTVEPEPYPGQDPYDDEEAYYEEEEYDFPVDVPQATTNSSRSTEWAVIDITDDDGSATQERYRSVFLESRAQKRSQQNQQQPQKQQTPPQQTQQQEQLPRYIPEELEGGDMPPEDSEPLYFPLQMPMSAPVSRPRYTPVFSQYLPPARTIVLPTPFQKHIRQLTQSAASTPSTSSPDPKSDLPQDPSQPKQPEAPAGTSKPQTATTPQAPGATQKRKVVSPGQAPGGASQQAVTKKVKTEVKVCPWDVMDLTDDDVKPLATPEGSQRGPVESVVGVLHSGALVTKKMEKGKEVEVVELDDKDWVSFGEVTSSIVGVQYCQGKVAGKEKITLVRDHSNEHDTNALRVINSSRVQVGNVPSEISAILSPLIDEKKIRVEANVSGPTGKYSIPIAIHLIGPAEAELEVLAHCHNQSLFIKTRQIMAELQRDQVRQQTAVRQQPVFQPQQSEQVSIEMTKQILEKLFDVLQEIQKNIPYTHDPPNLKTRLLPYQRQGLGWLRKREHPEVPKGKPFLFWEWREKERVFHNLITGTNTPTKPELPKGGLLADEMGLGKTIQIISLLLSDPQEPPILNAKDIYANTDPPDSPQEFRASESFVNWGKTTLIVCPLSVVGNWVTQIDAHVEPGRLTYYVFHGTNRNTDPSFLLQHDVVITTYQVLAGDYQKDRLTGLLTIPWLRVVLDEAHSIKSKQTKQSLAAYCLKAERRWCITGTPLQNSLDDLYSLVRFLHISPFDDPQWWNRVFTKPLKANESAGYSNLQALMQSLCLRRLKNMEINGKPIVNLPKRALYLCKVKFSDDEMKRYKEMESESSKTLETYMVQGKLADNYSHILVILGRLRQYCDHPSLCTTKENTHNKNEELSTILRDNECEDCSLCTYQITNPVITPCAHLFCRQCIERSIAESPRCPNCGSPLTKKQLIDEESAPRSKKNFIYQASGIKNSAKMNALMGYLIQTRQKDPEIKNVVFSQWTSMLDLLEIPLRRAGINFVRLDGSMNRMNRELSLSRFDTDPSITVFLVSLKCGGLGLNLTAASQIFMMDPWWNPATEDQAIDRVHRIGQKRNVVVIKFVIEGSVEERVIELQTKKRELMDKAFGVERQSRGERKENRIDDINFLVSGLTHRKD